MPRSGYERAVQVGIATWARKARDATEMRDNLIRRAHAEGLSLRAIGEAAGLTHSAIARIVNRG